MAKPSTFKRLAVPAMTHLAASEGQRAAPEETEPPINQISTGEVTKEAVESEMTGFEPIGPHEGRDERLQSADSFPGDQHSMFTF